MPVPPEDVVCRFIRQREWSESENRIKHSVFKQSGFSVWHKKRLNDNDVQLEDLRIDSLCGAGQIHFRVSDFTEIAIRISQRQESPSFEVRVEWRPECVPENFRKWNYAHVQVELSDGSKNFPIDFRKQLAEKCRERLIELPQIQKTNIEP